MFYAVSPHLPTGLDSAQASRDDQGIGEGLASAAGHLELEAVARGRLEKLHFHRFPSIS